MSNLLLDLFGWLCLSISLATLADIWLPKTISLMAMLQHTRPFTIEV